MIPKYHASSFPRYSPKTKTGILKFEEARDALIEKARAIVNPKIARGSTFVEQAWIDEKGIRLQIGYSCMGSTDYEYEDVTWKQLGFDK